MLIVMCGEIGAYVTIAKPGSIAISTRAPIGHIAITSKESCVNQGCRLIEPIGGSTSFWYYCANASVNILQSKGQGTTFMELPRSSLASTKFPVPPVEEQQKIAEFLDYKTAQIYALIAKKEDLLLKLQEKRSALITQAVTKGINPGAPMKPSGVEWLGAVPAYWNIKRLKFTVNLISDKIEAESSDLEYMGLEHIESWTGKRIEDEKAFSEGTASKFLKDDVLFGKLRPYLAKVYLANHTGLVSTEALVLRSKKVVYGGFLRYYMATRDFIDIVNSSTFGSKMPRANWDFIGNLPMLLPEYDEQVSIANFIESKLSQLDAQKKKVEDVIAKLQEYRAALITNAVTGKIDVRDFTIRINQKACPG